MKSIKQSVAILGGAFDPVHLGHLSLAEDAYREIQLDAVWFVPTARSPLKDHQPVLGASDRIDLLEAALEPFPYFKVDDSEIEQGGVSYTTDTIRRLNTRFPEIEFSWIIGGDQFAQLEKWKAIGELVRRLRFLVVSRPGFAISPDNKPTLPGLRFTQVSSRFLDIASSDIRERIALGKPVNDLLPKAVADLIVQRKFYL